MNPPDIQLGCQKGSILERALTSGLRKQDSDKTLKQTNNNKKPSNDPDGPSASSNKSQSYLEEGINTETQWLNIQDNQHKMITCEETREYDLKNILPPLVSNISRDDKNFEMNSFYIWGQKCNYGWFFIT